jgi:hypothetical protein
MYRLPDDLIAFLSSKSQLEYDSANSSIGQIKLKSLAELRPSTIEIYDGCQEIIDDPYSCLNGIYEVAVVDLVSQSEDYPTEGLLCWIAALHVFGSVDAEHGSVITLPGVLWTEIARNPVQFLDAQWEGHDNPFCKYALPWLHFRFRSKQRGLVIDPPPETCPVHGLRLATTFAQRTRKFEVYRRREIEQWLSKYVQVFPCGGLPISDSEMHCCVKCRSLEDQWGADVERLVVPIDVNVNSHGWTQCPGCGIRFSIHDENRFCDGIHMTCGQKIRIDSRG